jgi:hypothetical protein
VNCALCLAEDKSFQRTSFANCFTLCSLWWCPLLRQIKEQGQTRICTPVLGERLLSMSYSSRIHFCTHKFSLSTLTRRRISLHSVYNLAFYQHCCGLKTLWDKQTYLSSWLAVIVESLIEIIWTYCRYCALVHRSEHRIVSQLLCLYSREIFGEDSRVYARKYLLELSVKS